MLTNYHTLGYIASTLHPVLVGRRIDQIYTQNADEMVIGFGEGYPLLVYSCRREFNTLYLHDRLSRARANSTDVIRSAWGRLIDDVQLSPSDRVVRVQFASGERLLLQFFGAQSNALLVNSSGTILETFRKTRQPAGTQHVERTTELIYDPSVLATIASQPSDSLAVQSLRKLFPTLGKTLAIELLHRADLPPDTTTAALSPPSIKRLEESLRGLLLSLSHPAPRVYLDALGLPATFSLIPLLHLQGLQERRFEDVHAALRFYASGQHAGNAFMREITALRAALQSRHGKLSRSLAALESDSRDAERAGEYEHFGQVLMAHLLDFKKGDPQYIADGVSVPLDPSLTPVQNAQRYFVRARRARTAADETTTRRDRLQKELNAAAALLEGLGAVADREHLRAFRAEHAASLDLFGLTPRAQERAQLPFRRFVVDGGFEVWAGKTGANNDLLTFRHARPNDLWFHARGSGGSHVILKVGSGKAVPGKRAKEQAAAIAAFFSKMKTASIVPVAMTERKYVRKPRGAPAGTVTLERENVLFVEPGLPSTGDPPSHRSQEKP